MSTMSMPGDRGRRVGLIDLQAVNVVAVYRLSPPTHLPPHLISGKSSSIFSTKQQDFLLFAIQSLEQNVSLGGSS